MKQYIDLLNEILDNGVLCENRTGVKTKSIFGHQMKFDLSEGFPAVTTKKLAWKAVVGELLWFLEGSTDERRLAELTYGIHRTQLIDKKTIWTANADNQGKNLGYINNEFTKELGPIYGFQWRNFNGQGIDQLNQLIHRLKTEPDSRRLIINAWNPSQEKEMALPPCHVLIQFRVLGNKLHSQLYQRSADVPLGIPFNIASYSLLTHILARECGFEVGTFTHSIGDAHIYENQIEPIKEQLKNKPFNLPTLKIDDTFKLETTFPLNSINKFNLINYQSHNTIKMTMSV